MVDFTRVEHARGGNALSHFELLVQKEIAISSSALANLIREEEHEAAQEYKRIFHKLLPKAKISDRQRQCFEAVVLQGKNMVETAKALAVSRETVRSALKRVTRKLATLAGRYLEGRRLMQSSRFRLLTIRERTIFKLYYEELMGLSEIANVLGVHVTTVYQALRDVRKKKLKIDP